MAGGLGTFSKAGGYSRSSYPVLARKHFLLVLRLGVGEEVLELFHRDTDLQKHHSDDRWVQVTKTSLVEYRY